MINTLVETYLFEPANCVNIPHDSNIYIHNTYPVSLHPYNNGFDRNDPSISIDMVDCFFYCCYCVGPGNGKHVFLRMEGVVNCFRCNRDICSTCRLIKKKMVRRRKNIASIVMQRSLFLKFQSPIHLPMKQEVEVK